MKILYAALKYDYGVPERGYSFEHYNFYDTLVGMGHDVEYFDFFPLFQQHGSEGMTRILAQRVEDDRPDLLFVFLFGEQFDPVQLRKITTEKKTITFNWFADDHWRFDNFSKRWAPCFTFVSTTDARALPKYEAMGYKNVLLSQWAANPRLYNRGDGVITHDVTFVGQSYGDREAIIKALRRDGIDVRTWGSHWNYRRWHAYAAKLGLLSKKSLTQIVNSTRITQEEMIKVFQTSRINLNLSASSQNAPNQIKGRNFEIPSCAGFQLSGYAERLEEFFIPDREITYYRNTDELLEKVRYYLDHEEERAAIADAGYARVMKDHTYEQRFNELFRRMHLG